MATNALLTRAELGQVKKCQFNNPPSDHVFGYTPQRDPEGAREVTMLWKEHKTSLSASMVAPKADFKTLNKMAVDSGLTTAKELPSFRKEHMVTLKAPEERPKKLPGLPSTKNPKHTYGVASAYRSAEVMRSFGPEEPPVKYLVQGAYQDEWLRNNLEKEAVTQRDRPYIPPAPTKAVLGHSFGASRYLQPPSSEEPWKMSKFKTVGPKITQYSGGPFRASAVSPLPPVAVEDAAAEPAA